MKILHSIARLDLRDGGPVRAVIDLSEALAAKGHEIQVMVRAGPDTPPAWNEAFSRTTTIELGTPQIAGAWFSGNSVHRIRELIDRCDVVHIHGIWTPHNTQVASIARAEGKPHVVSCRGMLDDWCMNQRRLKKLVYLAIGGGASMLNTARLVHCTADGELRQSAKWFPGSTGVVIPNLLDLEPYMAMPGPQRAQAKFPQLARPEPAVLFLSRLHPKKGLEHLIEAARILKERGRPHQVLIAGTGPEEYERALRELADRGDVAHLVTFLGMVKGEDKVSLYQASTVFALPTSQENFGFVFYEALAAGCPVITTKGVDTWPELAQAGAIIIDQDARQLADGIERMTSDLDARQQLGARGRAWVLENLDPERLVQAYEDFYQRAVA